MALIKIDNIEVTDVEIGKKTCYPYSCQGNAGKQCPISYFFKNRSNIWKNDVFLKYEAFNYAKLKPEECNCSKLREWIIINFVKKGILEDILS